MMRKILLWASLGFIAIIVGASVVPGTLRPHTPLESTLEHFAAYALVSFWFTAILSGWIGRLICVGTLIALAGMLELVQLAIPGRTGELVDFAYSAAGALTGLAIGWAVIAFVASRQSRVRAESSASTSRL